MTKRRFYPPTESDIPMHGWVPYSEMHRERIRAHVKHDGNGGSMERLPFDHPQWTNVVLEEFGEVARVINDKYLGMHSDDYQKSLREELIQLGAMTAAWIDAIDLTTE
jgi:NTP pyrophosphatase (non-canonical NTP hydrolase)